MGASVTLDAGVFRDSRFHKLGRAIGVDRFSAIGRMAEAWSECTDQETDIMDVESLSFHLGCDEGAVIPALVTRADLGEDLGGGKVRMKGGKERLFWLAQRRAAGRKGGQRRAETAERRPDGTMAGTVTVHTNTSKHPPSTPHQTDSSRLTSPTATATATATAKQDLDPFPKAPSREGASPSPPAARRKAPMLELTAQPIADREAQPPDEWGKWLKRQRRKLKLRQTKLAGLLHVPTATVSAWERGSSEPSAEQRHRVTEALTAYGQPSPRAHALALAAVTVINAEVGCEYQVTDFVLAQAREWDAKDWTAEEIGAGIRRRIEQQRSVDPKIPFARPKTLLNGALEDSLHEVKARPELGRQQDVCVGRVEPVSHEHFVGGRVPIP